jgi:hypothetical protein
MSNYTKATNFATKDTLPTGDSGKIVKGTEIDSEFNAIASAISSKADTASPTFTGTPAAPTASAGSNTTQLATTAYVTAERTSTATLTNKTLTSPTLTSPVLGTPTSGTLTNCTGLPIVAGTTGTLSVARGGTGVTTSTGTGNVVLSASPTLTGTPVAPTASLGTNTTQLATTAFVTAALQAVYPVGSIYINASSSTNPATLLGFGTWTEFGAGRVLVGLNASDSLFDTLEETGGSKDAIVVSHTHTATSSVSDPGHLHQTGLLADDPSRMQFGSGGVIAGLTGSVYTTGAGSLTQTVATGISVSTSIASTGSSGTNGNLQPYITVRMWKRTA